MLEGLSNNREVDRNREGKVTIVGLGRYSKDRTTAPSKELGHAQTPVIIHFGNDYRVYRLR